MRKNIVEMHFDQVADTYDAGKERYSYYYSSLKSLLSKLIGNNKNVFEFGCGTGELLASLNPKQGIGYDISEEMIKIAKSKYKSKKNLEFTSKFSDVVSRKSLFINHESYIFLSDVVEHLDDHKAIFSQLANILAKDGRIIVTMANPIWEPLLMIWENLGLKMKEGKHKRVSFNDLKIMIQDLGMKVEKHDYKLLIPLKIPLITNFANRYLEKYLKRLAFIEYFVVTKSQ